MRHHVRASLLLAPLALAAGTTAQLHIRPGPGAQVRLTSLRIEARVAEGVATTTLRQTFHNDGPRIAEGSWVLPLPSGATADGFTMTVGGKEVASEVLDAQRARQIYEDIVRRQRDPGLLEYFGTGCLRARAFPIPARGEIDVSVRYRQILPATAGLHTWSFPLRATSTGGRIAEKLSLDLEIRSRVAIKNVWSPVAEIDVVRKDDHTARASCELAGGRLQSRDLSVFYGLADGDFGLHLLTHRKAGAPGFFLLMVSPSLAIPEPKNTSRVLNFVIDTSGSMQGKKIEQARDALRFFVQSLRPQDRFNIVPFSTEARPFFDAPVPAHGEHLEQALARIGEIQARGGTNIEDGLRAALTAPLPATDGHTSVPITVFLTDGQPTVGTTDIKSLLSQTKSRNTHKARIFVFGVGNDVNTHLLDKIAEDSRGDRDYVRETEDIEVKTGALFTKLSHPVLTSVELICDRFKDADVLPRTLPDLFKGSRLLAMGRYEGSGHHPIRLRGTVNGQHQEFVYEGHFAESGEHDFLPALWAERKVGVLLDAIRLNGANPELLNEIRRLGRDYGIVTPYTSHLILEDGARVSRARGFRTTTRRFANLDAAEADRVAGDLLRSGAFGFEAKRVLRLREELGRTADAESSESAKKLGYLPQAPASGAVAIDQSVALRALSKGEGAAADDGSVTGLVSRRIADRTFHLIDGVWVDGAFRAAMQNDVRRIAAFSEEYFALLHQHPELTRYLAFSARLVLVVDGQAIEIA